MFITRSKRLVSVSMSTFTPFMVEIMDFVNASPAGCHTSITTLHGAGGGSSTSLLSMIWCTQSGSPISGNSEESSSEEYSSAV